MRQVRALALAAGLAVLAGGASVYTLRALGDDGCPSRKHLQTPTTTFEQAPKDYVTVTLHNPNPCYGFLDEPVEITLYGPNGRRAITYDNDPRAPHGDVGVCCAVTLPPHGTWTVRLGSERHNPKGLDHIRICNIHVEALKSQGYSVWKRMPDGGAITGHGSFPPKSAFDPDKFTSRSLSPEWRAPCDTP